MKLLCDQMLGSLATWLRFLGFDTFYTTDILSDDKILNIADDDQRILITMDKELMIRAKKNNIPLIELKTIDLDEQIKKVISTLTIDKSKILTRCSICNSLLNPIEKNRVKGKIPKKIYLCHDTFWSCSHCDKIYWRGSHYDKIIEKIASLQS